MVEIREESTESNSGGAGTSSSSSNQSQPRQTSIIVSVIALQRYCNATGLFLQDYVKANGSEALCFGLRLVTIYFTAFYVLPISTAAYQKTAYGKAFLAGSH